MRSIKTIVSPVLAGLLAVSLASCASTPVPEVSPGATYDGPALTEERFTTALKDAEKILAEGDAAKDGEKLSARFAGDALAARTAAYTLATKTDGAKAPTPLSFTPQVTLPAITDSFPRYAAVITQVPEGQTSPVLLTMTQADARQNYHVDHWARLFPGVTFPDLPAAATGTEFLAPDDSSLKQTPSAAVAAYARAINEPDSEEAKSLGNDPLRTQITETVTALTESLAEVGEASWKAGSPTSEPVAFRTADGGAVVVGTIPTVLTLKKTVARSTLTVSDDLAALAGEDPVEDQLKASYQIMIALYVPAADAADAATRPLGGEQTLMSAKRGE